MALDEDRAKDHIQKLKGKLEASSTSPLQLNGGLLSQVQQLQESGHATVGFKGVSEFDAIISVAKPTVATELGENPEEVVHGEEVDVKVLFPNLMLTYPFSQAHITHIRTLARRLTEQSNGNE